MNDMHSKAELSRGAANCRVQCGAVQCQRLVDRSCVRWILCHNLDDRQGAQLQPTRVALAALLQGVAGVCKQWCKTHLSLTAQCEGFTGLIAVLRVWMLSCECKHTVI